MSADGDTDAPRAPAIEPREPVGWGADDQALFVDLYELTMAQAYLAQGLCETAIFDLFIRHLPARRNFLLTCGLDAALDYLETVTFRPAAIAYLDSLGRFSPEFLEALGAFRFSGDVDAMPEGTVVFADEPLLQVIGPLYEAQITETLLLNQIHFETVVASKGARAVQAAAGRPLIDFGSRRAHGFDAGLRAARALYVAGFAGTSNLLAGQRFGIPPAGTMAHSYIEAHNDELEAFRHFVRQYPETILLVDTYDTLDGVRNVIRLASELGSDFRIQAIRLDSGDLADLAVQSRRMLDEAGLNQVNVLAGGGLDEYAVAELVRSGAPIHSFALGTHVVTSADAPSLDAVYKLSAYAGSGRMKLSTEKVTLPGRKQVFRRFKDGVAVEDRIALHDEQLDGEPLLVPVMRGGRRLPAGRVTLEETRARAQTAVGQLAEPLRGLDAAPSAYPVRVSDALRAEQSRLRERLGY
ncbi:MAG: nicotinate phosphoribosyltransferase [Dehalococcoidia bacterium]